MATKQERSLQRLRWNLLVLIPIEDIIQLTLAFYLWVSGNQSFWGYLSFVISLYVICARFFILFLFSKGITLVDGNIANNYIFHPQTLSR